MQKLVKTQRIERVGKTPHLGRDTGGRAAISKGHIPLDGCDQLCIIRICQPFAQRARTPAQCTHQLPQFLANGRIANACLA